MPTFSDREVIALRSALSASRGEVMRPEQVRAVLDVAISAGYVTRAATAPPEPVMWLLTDAHLDAVAGSVTASIPDVEPRSFKDARAQALTVLQALADAGAFTDGPSPLTFQDDGRRIVISFIHPDGTTLSARTAFTPEDFVWEPGLYAEDVNDDGFEQERKHELAAHFAMRALTSANAKVKRYERTRTKG